MKAFFSSFKTTLFSLFFLLIATAGWGQTTLAGWTFPVTSGAAANTLPSDCGNPISNFYADGTNGSSNWDDANSRQYFAGNANSSAPCATALPTGAYTLVNSNSHNGKAVVFKISTYGYKDLVLTYDTRGTGTGFATHIWSYSTDGDVFTDVSTIIGRNNTAFTSKTVDFSSIGLLNNISTVYIKLILSGATGTGNNRLDNIKFVGTTLPLGKTVAFNANGGTGTMANQTSSVAANLTVNAFTRTGYDFTNWHTIYSGTGGISYGNGDSYPFTTNETLYAQWTINQYNVSYDLNGGTGTVPMTQTGNFNTNITLPTGAGFSRVGFVFSGWNTAANGSGTSYTSGGSYLIPALSQMLYAQWQTTAPFINTTGALTALNTIYGTASPNTSFTVSAGNLTSNLSVTAPIGFEISENSTSGFATSLTLGTTTLTDRSIYVRLAATTAVGSYSGNVSLTSAGATTVTVPTVNSTVSKKELTITGISVNSRNYNGNTVATLGGSPTLNGIVGSDDVTRTGGTAVFEDKNVGTEKTVIASGFGLSGAKAGNYTLLQPAGLKGTITPKPLTITAPSIASKVYDGSSTSGAVTVGNLSGFVGTETVTATATGTYGDSNAGTGKTATITYVLANGANGGLATNFSLATGTGAGSITKATPIYAAATISFEVGGTQTINASISNSPETLTFTSGNTGIATVSNLGVVTGVAVGSTSINVTQTESANYFGGSTTVTVNVNDVVVGTYETTSAGRWPNVAGSTTATWRRMTSSGWENPADRPLENTTDLLIIKHAITTNTNFGTTGSGTSMVVENQGIFTANHPSTLLSIHIKNGGEFVVGATGVVMNDTGAKKIIESGGVLTIGADLSNSSNFWRGAENFKNNSTVNIGGFTGALIAKDSQISKNANGYLFGNLTFSGSTAITLISLNDESKIDLVENDLTLNGTNNNILITSASSKNIKINGNIIINAGTLRGMSSLSSITINGNLEINNGTFNIAPTLNSQVFAVKLKGDLKLLNESQLITTDVDSELLFEGVGDGFSPETTQNVSIATTASVSNVRFKVNAASYVKLNSNIALVSPSSWTVNTGGTLDFGFDLLDSALKISGHSFESKEGSILKITSPVGIQSTGATGNVQTTTRTFATTGLYGDYHYIGNAAQLTGNALPANVRNLFINTSDKNNEVTLSNATLNVKGQLAVEKGIFNLNGKDVIGTSSSSLKISALGELKIIGEKTFPTQFGTITFEPLSTVHYAGSNQIVANSGTTGIDNLLSYQTLKVSGTGIKTSTGTTTVNGNTTVNSGELLVAETADSALPNVFVAAAGLAVIPGATFRLANNANLMQNPTATNSGNIIAERTANIKRLDYVYWSSPVSNQQLKMFSPGTLINRFYTYDEPTNSFTVVDYDGNFQAGKGYSIRAKNNQSTSSTSWLGQFVGTPNNGSSITPISFTNENLGNNLIGNPYPSHINFNQLADDNSALIQKIAYFWTNTNPNGSMQNDGYPKSGLINNYAIYNGTGGTPATGPATNATPGNPATISSPTPNGIIKAGQGFIVKGKKAGDLQFNNSVRSTAASDFFNKSSSAVDRFWLNLTTPLQVQTTILIGYKDSATNGFEFDYDAPLMTLGVDALFSILDSEKLAIQGRKAPLNVRDVVALGTSHYNSGDYIFSLGAKEGIFANGQNIYLKDNQTNTMTNLSAGNYTFAASAGLTEGRFEIVYENEIVLGTGTTKRDDLVVYRDGNDFIVKSPNRKISDAEVYDTSGRLLIKLSPNQTELRIDGSAMINGIYVLKIDRNGEVNTKKITK